MVVNVFALIQVCFVILEGDNSLRNVFNIYDTTNMWSMYYLIFSRIVKQIAAH